MEEVGGCSGSREQEKERDEESMEIWLQCVGA